MNTPSPIDLLKEHVTFTDEEPGVLILMLVFLMTALFAPDQGCQVGGEVPADPAVVDHAHDEGDHGH